MRRYLIERHYINDESTLEEYARGVSNITAASAISDDYGLELGLKLTVDGKRLSKELQERARELTMKLPLSIWILYDPEDRGPGTSYRQVLFNPTFSSEPSIVVNADLDQYIIDTRESLEQIAELTKRVEKEGAIYAAGSRDVPVVLATNKRNNDLRAIHELFHSSIIGSDRLRVETEILGVTPAYAKIGESTSGVFVINHSHLKYPELIRCVADATQKANMKGFAIDYYVAIKSSQLGNLSKGYVKSKENKFYALKDEQEELESIKRIISGQTKELGKTDIRDVIACGLANKSYAETLARFYPREDVELVRDLMLQSL